MFRKIWNFLFNRKKSSDPLEKMAEYVKNKDQYRKRVLDSAAIPGLPQDIGVYEELPKSGPDADEYKFLGNDEQDAGA